ncbi:hypothetical protein FRC09_001864 [Ceratobasidium sp. 395]|nr:hypothetical protein FRC09_001864 [Ceratobasidium sp. 395]
MSVISPQAMLLWATLSSTVRRELICRDKANSVIALAVPNPASVPLRSFSMFKMALKLGWRVQALHDRMFFDWPMTGTKLT